MSLAQRRRLRRVSLSPFIKKKAFRLNELKQLNKLNKLQPPEPLNLKLCLGGKNV